MKMLGVLTALVVGFATNLAVAEDYIFMGTADFSNLQGFFGNGEDVPYLAVGSSTISGKAPQRHTGSIRATSIPVFVVEEDTTTITFSGIQGPNPHFGKRSIHLIVGRGGQIHCTWTADFKIVVDNATGMAVFEGDGQFTVVGGTGQYKNATGAFRTLFVSEPTPLSSDTAVADVVATGTINR